MSARTRLTIRRLENENESLRAQLAASQAETQRKTEFAARMADLQAETARKLDASQARVVELEHELAIGNERADAAWAGAVKRADDAEAREAKLRTALEDIRDHGCRHDTTPTMTSNGWPTERWYAWCQAMDKVVRDRARLALGAAQPEPPEAGGGLSGTHYDAQPEASGERPWQDELTSEGEKCRHGLYSGTSCHDCIRAGRFGSHTYGPVPDDCPCGCYARSLPAPQPQGEGAPKAAIDVECPECGEPAGRRCVLQSSSLPKPTPHLARMYSAKAESLRAEVLAARSAPCPTCARLVEEVRETKKRVVYLEGHHNDSAAAIERRETTIAAQRALLEEAAHRIEQEARRRTGVFADDDLALAAAIRAALHPPAEEEGPNG